MLDGLLGRGFASKCKSLIKLTKSRIDVLRRKRNATLKFLKKDIADLLANGLDINAYGRAGGLLDEMRLSSNLEFVDKSCDFVLKHLSVMQKQRECPEEARDTVSSLMYAAAGFSELPELRDLRHIFHERYGDLLELFVNQEFVANLLAKPFSTEKKVTLMQDIASEFSIPWDSRAFEQTMSKPNAYVQDQPKNYGSFHVTDDKHKLKNGQDTVPRGDKHDFSSKERLEHANDGHRLRNGKEDTVSKRSEFIFQSRQELSNDRHKPPLYDRAETLQRKDKHEILFQGRIQVASEHEPWNVKEDTALRRARSSSSSKRMERLDAGPKLVDGRENRENNVPVRDSPDILPNGKPDITPYGGLQLKNKDKDPFGGNNSGGEYNNANSTRKVQEEDMHKPKPYFNNALPPPYVKPNVKPKDSEYGASNTDFDGKAIPEDPSSRNRAYAGSRSERVYVGCNHPDNNRQVIVPARVDGHGHDKDNSYQDDGINNPLPKPRSFRRRRLKSPSSHDNVGNAEDMGAVKRKSRSRRRDNSRRGLQILFDDEHYQNDEEERIIDKLLMHYSKKPSSYEPGKVRSKSKSHHAHHVGTDEGETPQNRSRDGSDDMLKIVPPPTRSISFPHEQTAQPETRKVFTRAASFQPNRSNVAQHVHPKLPDYDDLAAQFAALKGR